MGIKQPQEKKLKQKIIMDSLNDVEYYVFQSIYKGFNSVLHIAKMDSENFNLVCDKKKYIGFMGYILECNQSNNTNKTNINWQWVDCDDYRFNFANLNVLNGTDIDLLNKFLRTLVDDRLCKKCLNLVIRNPGLYGGLKTMNSTEDNAFRLAYNSLNNETSFKAFKEILGRYR